MPLHDMVNKKRNTQAIGDLINDRLHKRGLRANQVAERAGIHETTFSAIRAGRRRVSPDMAAAIARALSTSPEEEEQDINEFLVAAGFAPRALSKRRPVVIELLNQDALLEIEEAVRCGQQIWVFSPGLIETFQKRFFTVVCKNLAKGVAYTYFFHHSNALQWGILHKQLKEKPLLLRPELLKAFVLPDESFRTEDPKLFECIYGAESEESFRVFRTSREVQDEYMYREENKHEANEIRNYLKNIKEAAKGKNEPPCSVEKFLEKTYGSEVARKLLMKAPSRKTNR